MKKVIYFCIFAVCGQCVWLDVVIAHPPHHNHITRPQHNWDDVPPRPQYMPRKNWSVVHPRRYYNNSRPRQNWNDVSPRHIRHRPPMFSPPRSCRPRG